MKKILCLTLLFLLINPLNAIAQQPIQDVVPHYETMQLGRGTVNTFAWRPDGEMIAVGGSQGIWLYDPYFQFIDFLDAPDVTELEWHSNGTHFASAGEDGSITLWAITDLIASRPLKTTEIAVTALVWAGDVLLAGQGDGTIQSWNLDGQPLAVYNGVVTALESNHAATQFAGISSAVISIWELTHPTPIQQFSVENPFALAWNLDASKLAVANESISILNSVSGELISTLKGHTAEVNDLAWSPDGKWLASVSGHIFEGSELRLWDGITYEPISVFPGTAALHTLEWRPGELAQGSQITIAGEDNIVRTFDAATGAVIAMLQGHSNAIESIAWSPDGTEIASASDDGIIRVWDAATGDAVASFQGHTRGTNTVAWSPNGLMIASAGWDNTVRIWMRSTGKVRAVLTGHRDRVWMVAWSPDGKTLASASRDATIKLWNPYTGEILKTLIGNNGEMSSVAWKFDGTQIAGSSDDGSVWLWDVATGEPIHTLQGHNRYVWSLAWQPGGDRLISSSWWDGTLRIWDTRAGERVGSLNSIQVLALSWSPGGSYLATSSADGVIRVWDYADGRVLQVLDSRAGKVYTVAWKPDGSQLASAGTDGIIRLWSE